MVIRLVFLFLFPLMVAAQDPSRFGEEIRQLTSGDDTVDTEDLVLFTGSSSIRMWKDVANCFGGNNVLNRGFGGSQMSDLVYYYDKLIEPYNPEMIFIYEGDNDISANKTVDEILGDAENLLLKIRRNLPSAVKVAFISPKPSIARAHLKEKYVAYNAALKEWAAEQKNVLFIDVWTPMLDSNSEVMKDIFLDDGLHMNSKGYAIWTRVIMPFMP